MFLTNLLKKRDACNSPKSGVAVGKMLADVAKPQRAQQRIGDRVDDDITIGMGNGADVGRHDDPAEDELAAWFEAVDVVTVTDAEGHFARFLWVIKRCDAKTAGVRQPGRRSCAPPRREPKMRHVILITPPDHTP